MTKINKALDLNKLFSEQKKGKLLKKNLTFPLFACTKYDGNYTINVVQDGKVRHYTSGGLTYTHTDNDDTFSSCIDGVYLAERISGKGKLGDRSNCNLRGPKTAQTSTKHNYKVFDYLTLVEYSNGIVAPYNQRYYKLAISGIAIDNIAKHTTVYSQVDLDSLLAATVKAGYEGLMCMHSKWLWKDTKSRTIEFCKYKKRPTVDLLCIDTLEGEGKYTGVTGSLVLQDSKGRIVKVGSGLSDSDRCKTPDYFIGKIVEIEYEHIMATYIQPTFIAIRQDKTIGDID
jgi:ATP-dependent DNA ligase